MAEHRAHHQHFVLKTSREQGSNRAINQTCCQRFLFGWPRFTLEKAARHLACGVVFFLVVHGQGKEILTGLG